MTAAGSEGGMARAAGSGAMRASLAVALGALAALLVLYPGSLREPFFSDDYILLDKVRGASFASLFSARALAYGYWRPWSRELHFAILERAFGARPLPFHLVSLALAAATILLYFTLARRMLGARGAVLAGCGLAALAAWELPVRWAAAAQDLWMLAFALASLNALALGRTAAACIALALGLLSKETAAVLPAIAFVHEIMLQGLSPARAARRVTPLVIVTLAWLAVHPAFGGRWWWARGVSLPVAAYQSPAIAMVRSLLASLNLDAPLRPRFGWPRALALGLPGALLPAACAAWAARRIPSPRGRPPADAIDSARLPTPVEDHALAGEIGLTHVPAAAEGHILTGSAWRVAGFGLLWAAIAWLPLALPFLIWQPYYALFGGMGLWIAIAAGLDRRPAISVAAIVSLALLRVARIETPVWEWGDAVLQAEGRRFMARTEAFLRLRHPILPRGARLFFTGVPRGMVFVAGPGDAPALRVWFDRSVHGSFWADYRARTPAEGGGEDYFFAYDPARGWREVVAGARGGGRARGGDDEWRSDHERLALTFAKAENPALAEAEYATLASADTGRADYAYLAALSADLAGDRPGAKRWYAEAARRPGADRAMKDRWERVRHGAP